MAGPVRPRSSHCCLGTRMVGSSRRSTGSASDRQGDWWSPGHRRMNRLGRPWPGSATKVWADSQLVTADPLGGALVAHRAGSCVSAAHVRKAPPTGAVDKVLHGRTAFTTAPSQYCRSSVTGDRRGLGRPFPVSRLGDSSCLGRCPR